MNYIMILAIAFIFFLNIYATFRLWLKTEFNQFQKIAQSIIVWLLPLLGSFLVLVFIKEDEKPKGPDNPNDGQGVDGMPGGVQ